MVKPSAATLDIILDILLIEHGGCLQLIMNTESVSFPNTLLGPPLIMLDSMAHDVMFN